MSKLKNSPAAVDELLTRGVAEVINAEHLRQRLLAGRPLRIKLGIDPTSPNIHLGRAVVLWKLRAFQELGHKVIFIVGDFTGVIGDTSDKEAERPMLTEAEIKRNLKTYFRQALTILDPKQTETRYNSSWLKKLNFHEIGKLADLFGLHEFESRELISKRLQAGKRVSLRELLYPLMQGYDSVAIKADVEIGGTDQKFNLLAGRTIQPAYGQPAQDILTMTLMEGTDGRKMSSSWGNVINLTDSAGEMVGKVMSLPDQLLGKYFLLATRLPLEEIGRLPAAMPNPRDQKLHLAENIAALYHGPAAAAKARAGFIAQFSNGELPAQIPLQKLPGGSYQLVELLAQTGLAASKSEARRLLQQGGVKLNGKVAVQDQPVSLAAEPLLLQVGKRKFLKLQKR
ncbi:MAG TPA: tyrosine--tRNA ligase [Patescibacteria group bacterium]|nr:tyrosine--tRNA ligase [Patescibacteria group bacterium]